MSNDNGLVDEYEKLAIQKKEIEQKEIELKNKIFQLAKEKNTNVLFGINKKCLIKEYEKVIFPDDKTEIVELIKKKGLYEKFSSVNYLKLSPAIIKMEVDREILDLTKKQKAFRIFLKEKL